MDNEDRMEDDEVPKPKLEIHHVSISGGDATVIVTRNDDGTIDQKVLIDLGGEKSSDFVTVVTYCNQHFGDSKFDYVIVSHYHNDHYGGLLKQSEDGDKSKHLRFEKIVDGTTGRVCTKHSDVENNNHSKFYNALTKKKEDFISVTKYFKNNEKPYIIDLKKNSITLTCYCANGILADGTIIEGKFKNWNDRSMVWVLNYKKFNYFTAGDLSGETTGSYTNVEEPVVNYLFGDNKMVDDDAPSPPLEDVEISVLKANHHGSNHSSYGYNDSNDYSTKSYFFEKVKPKEVIVTCHNDKHGLPRAEFFDRMKAHKINNVVLVNPFKRFKNNADPKHILKEEIINYWQNFSNMKIRDNNYVTNEGQTAGFPVAIVSVDKIGLCNIDSSKYIELAKGSTVRLKADDIQIHEVFLRKNKKDECILSRIDPTNFKNFKNFLVPYTKEKPSYYWFKNPTLECLTSWKNFSEKIEYDSLVNKLSNLKRRSEVNEFWNDILKMEGGEKMNDRRRKRNKSDVNSNELDTRPTKKKKTK
ncbi:MAG: MBL fold metallo-hydrolase [Balneola sp.]|jgi:hypothetical protein